MVFKPLSCVYGNFVIAQRYIMVVMMHLALLNGYQLRVVVNIAMAEMKTTPNTTRKVDACPMYQEEYIEGMTAGRYEWSSKEESWILGGFYFGYLIGHIPGGWLADKIGARHVMGFCILSSSILTFFYPLCIESESLAVAVFMRIFVGFLQGPMYPCLSAFINCWVPPTQRSFLGSIAYSGSSLGTITGNILTGYIIGWTKSWQTPFYIWPVCALVWYVFFLVMVFSEPGTHPFITKEELEYLEREVPKRMKIKVPWKAIFSSTTMIALIAGQIGHDYLFYTMITYLPKYMKDILKMNIKKNALYTALPFVFKWISSLLCAYIADWVLNRELLSVLSVRRLWTAFSGIVPTCLLILVVYIGCNRTASVILYMLVMFCHGPYFAGHKVNVNDVTRYYGGSVMAIVNGLGALSGVVSLYLIGIITKDESLEEWQVVMWIIFGVTLCTTVLYCTFARAEREPWDYPEEMEDS